MADDPNALLGALSAALAALAPQIRGLKTLAAAPISAELAAAINKQLTALTRRSDLINAVLLWLSGEIQALAALRSDGYPAPPVVDPITPALLAELQGENVDLEAAVGLFMQIVANSPDDTQAIADLHAINAEAAALVAGMASDAAE